MSHRGKKLMQLQNNTNIWGQIEIQKQGHGGQKRSKGVTGAMREEGGMGSVKKKWKRNLMSEREKN